LASDLLSLYKNLLYVAGLQFLTKGTVADLASAIKATTDQVPQPRNNKDNHEQPEEDPPQATAAKAELAHGSRSPTLVFLSIHESVPFTNTTLVDRRFLLPTS
jgi:hypothetical protein